LAKWGRYHLRYTNCIYDYIYDWMNLQFIKLVINKNILVKNLMIWKACTIPFKRTPKKYQILKVFIEFIIRDKNSFFLKYFKNTLQYKNWINLI
jgi:hypothetical protein